MAGNPLSLRAGMACLDLLERPGTYETMAELADVLSEGIVRAAHDAHIPITLNRYGGAFAVFFGEHPVSTYEQACATDGAAFAQFFHAMLARGVVLAPSKYEAWFVGTEHTRADIDTTLCAVAESFRAMRQA